MISNSEKQMKIVVIGLGSMGKRRIRLIKEMYPSFSVCGVDGREDRRKEASGLFGIKCFGSIDEAEADCAFICTSPLSHAALITECLKKKWNVFTELNLVSDGYEENMNLADRTGCVLFLSSTFFYREEITYIREHIADAEKWNYIYHIGQYLPDWHPWENYKEFFLGDKRTNGCREILAIELPWITGAFGKVTNVNAVSDKLTELNIDYHDNYMIQVIHENGSKGSLIVDVVSPCAVRKLEAYSENEYLSWEGTPESLKHYDKSTKKLENVKLSEAAEHVEGYRSFVVENAYKNEIREFFDVVLNGKEPLYGFEQDKEILQLIDSIGA